MTIKATCGVCGRTLSAPDDAAGTARMCPNCGELVKIPDTSAGLLAELVQQTSSLPPRAGVGASGAASAAPPEYVGLRIVTVVLRALAFFYYGLSVLAFVLSVAEVGGSRPGTALLSAFLVPLGIATAGVLMHGLADACVALRDMARNSFESRKLTEQVQAAAGATNEATDRIVSVLEEQRDKLVETVASAARSLAEKLDERGREA